MPQNAKCVGIQESPNLVREDPPPSVQEQDILLIQQEDLVLLQEQHLLLREQHLQTNKSIKSKLGARCRRCPCGGLLFPQKEPLFSSLVLGVGVAPAGGFFPQKNDPCFWHALTTLASVNRNE